MQFAVEVLKVEQYRLRPLRLQRRFDGGERARGLADNWLHAGRTQARAYRLEGTGHAAPIDRLASGKRTSRWPTSA
jgi:hypothetical protein